MPLDLTKIRAQFPSLDRPAIFFDNPGGTQIAQASLDRMVAYLTQSNANKHGTFQTSIDSDMVIEETHQAMADFVNAARPEEIVFGPNMTSLTFNLSRSLARTWMPGDEIVVTRLDHDANVTPWVLAARDQGVKVRYVDFHLEDGTLNMDAMAAALEARPRLVAVGYASNALGTINPVEKIIPMAHDIGALVFVDAVQFAPHGLMDVQELGCDFLVSSAYKYFGPHVGALYGRYELLDELIAYQVRPAPNDPPGKFMTGTQNHEGIAGLLGALEYLEWLGTTFGEEYQHRLAERYSGRQLRLKQGILAAQAYEYEISRALLEILEETPGVHLYGLRDVRRLEERVPTFAFNLQGKHPRKVAEELAKEDIYVWDGNYYALQVTEQLGVEANGGMVRVGPVHYNTLEEVQKFGEVLGKIATQP